MNIPVKVRRWKNEDGIINDSQWPMILDAIINDSQWPMVFTKQRLKAVRISLWDPEFEQPKWRNNYRFRNVSTTEEN